MPDKKAYVEEMVRVLKPGGTLVIACWCQVRRRTRGSITPLFQARDQRFPLIIPPSATPRRCHCPSRSSRASISCAQSGATLTSSPSRTSRGLRPARALWRTCAPRIGLSSPSPAGATLSGSASSIPSSGCCGRTYGTYKGRGVEGKYCASVLLRSGSRRLHFPLDP